MQATSARIIARMMCYNSWAMDFVPLHVYSGSSLLKSCLLTRSIVKNALKTGARYCALSDYGNASSFPELDHLCKANGLTPVFGFDIEIEGVLFSCFIGSEEGYRNALALIRFFSEGRLTIDYLQDHSQGLSVVLCTEQSKMHDDYLERADELPAWLARLSKGIEDFYLGIPYLPDERSFASYLRNFSAAYPYSTIAFPHIVYEKADDAIGLAILSAIAKNETLTEKEAKGTKHFLSEEELDAYYSRQELLETTHLVGRLDFEFVKKRGGLLRFPNEQGLSSEDYLRQLALEGLSKKNPGYGPAYRQRLDYELSVINKMGYADYFLLVGDYVRFAKTHGISVGPGRGSGAGSLVSYSLDIVTVDPLRYDLLFERFLNPDRQSMPDIDVDFADTRRSEVIDYLRQKYGEDHVAHIITFQTIGAKRAIRDIGMVFGYEQRQIDLLSKSIDDRSGGLRDNYRKNQRFRALVDSDKFYLEIVSLAVKIEGFPRQSGLHAAGIVINDAPLSQAIPVSVDPASGYVIQYEMNYLEEQGFLKMDILGLINLSLIDRCLALIEKTRGVHLTQEQIPYDEEDSIRLICEGKTMGLFQLESPGMNRAIRTLKPTTFDDVAALIALFRPGPMANIPVYARRKHGQEPVTYPCPALEPILSSTYGVLIYQEQVTQMVRALAGYSFAQADLFRRAISKKDARKLESMRGDFISGCLKNGYTAAFAQKIYDMLFRFGDYGFNKSHTVSYSIIACRMAYLKRHYPLEFYSTILGNYQGNDGRGQFAQTVAEVKKEGIALRVPDINEAGLSFLPKGNAILFPFTSINGVRGDFARDLIDEREHYGAFTDIFDFARRMLRFGLNQKTFIALIDAGCFDSFPHNRPSLRLSSSDALKYAEMMGGDSGREVLLDLNFPKPAMRLLPDERLEDLAAELTALGMMVSGSPLEMKKDKMAEERIAPLSELMSNPAQIEVAGVVSECKSVTTKKGKRMAFLTLYDQVAVIEMVLFAETYDQARPFLERGTLVRVKCHKNDRRDGYVADEIRLL